MYCIRCVLVARPKPSFQYYNSTIEIKEPVTINCSINAVPRPKFQWILADTEESLPESSWNFTNYDNKMATSNLNHRFELTDLNEYCRIHVLCIAMNHHGRSEHHFNLCLNSSENHCISPSISSPIPSVTTDGGENILKIVLPPVLSAVLVVAVVICVVLIAVTVCNKIR